MNKNKLEGLLFRVTKGKEKEQFSSQILYKAKEV